MPSYEISRDQIAQFQRDGYLLLKNALPDAQLAAWRRHAEALEQRALSEHRQQHYCNDYCVVEDPVGPRLMRFDNLFGYHPQACTELLGCPAMLAVARQLCGLGCVPLQMDLLYKHQHPHPVINWHQGAQHDRQHPYLNVGVYLDDAPAGDGCLRYVPGTQHGLEPIQTLSEQHGWEVPGVVEQPAQAGDILIQDMMILHGSQPKRSDGTRRTLYIELRPLEAILTSGAQSEQWAQLRKQWMAQVLSVVDAAEVPSVWQHYYGSPEADLEALVTKMMALKEPPLPAVWATHPVDHPDYPVPADLR
ncbi:phytanoyl-CoA dioxygenase family protein [Ferrimonas sp. SCSIO 43195]|uniref:phytanoyl-CoA dioxygenase family protein n=1 Tax=Ferrimonas sp. SCSIO 43195 TaxID=2822844 RepID=UPI002074E7EA|nr:phytanoyl-CoA dioxygenase family protein [Ferrimonas sp. SCSIO 43195]USD35903.1 phytanoyl-CoA dioxygenase family protein [Ferrimonas sp. SCSIO 43195]